VVRKHRLVATDTQDRRKNKQFRSIYKISVPKMEGKSIMRLVEVGPRDGLQNETAPVPLEAKIAFIDALSQSGVDEIEVSAFVSPHWVPQLSDAEGVFDGIHRREGVTYSALVPNRKGVDRALAVGVNKIAVFTAASETFNDKNINTSLAGSIQRFQPVVLTAIDAGLPVRGYISTAFWCAFEGRINPRTVLSVVERLDDIGVDEMAISDTIGKASPDEVRQLLDLLLPRLPADRIAVHFHDTYGRGVANTMAAWACGIRTVDASVGGLGGCPYAPGATGNVATQDVVTALEAKGVKTGIDLEQLNRAYRVLDPYLVDERRKLPRDGSPACAACEFASGEICCGKYTSSG
jgi:hydroxymethylglutaryl-CoA lyase